MNTQQQYWQEMVTLKRDARYVDLYLARTECTDRYIKGFLAIAASSSIAGWAIIREYAFFWGFVVALSQVLQVVKTYLPYKARLKALSLLSAELNTLSLLAESDWYGVCEGKLYDDDVHELRMALKKKKTNAVKKAFPSSGLPKSEKLIEQANKENDEYFSTYLEPGNDV